MIERHIKPPIRFLGDGLPISPALLATILELADRRLATLPVDLHGRSWHLAMVTVREFFAMLQRERDEVGTEPDRSLRHEARAMFDDFAMTNARARDVRKQLEPQARAEGWTRQEFDARVVAYCFTNPDPGRTYEKFRACPDDLTPAELRRVLLGERPVSLRRPRPPRLPRGETPR